MTDLQAAPALRLHHLTSGYRGVPMTGELSADFYPGEITVFIGPNGAGKSTILKTITGELPPTGGGIDLDGHPLSGYRRKELARRMAVVLTERVRPEFMTCREVAAAGRYPYTGITGRLSEEDYRKVDRAIREVHAETIADRLFPEASDGERQRILLARALCQEPEILVLDEPTSFLDIRYKLEFLTILRKLARNDGLSIILSLHEIALAAKIADRVISVRADHSVSVDQPEKAFCEKRIRELFGIRDENFDPIFASALSTDR